MLNSLRFLQCTFLGAADLKPPADVRQRFSAFFFMLAVIYEGLLLLKRMGKHFRGSKSWRQKIVPILRHRTSDKLFTASMDPLRNQAVFHFFEDAIRAPRPRVIRKTTRSVPVPGGNRSKYFANSPTFWPWTSLSALSVPPKSKHAVL
jgi:hypothetical protein